MRRMASLSVAALFMVAGLAACGTEQTTAPANQQAQGFSVVVSGARRDSTGGQAAVNYLPFGWTETSGDGTTRYSSDVQLLALNSSRPSGPRLNLGLLGSRVSIGSYRVRRVGGSFGSVPEFYGDYNVTNGDGSTTMYQATSGTVNITAVSDSQVSGTFSFHASWSATFPANASSNTKVSAVPTSLDVSGVFTAQVR